MIVDDSELMSVFWHWLTTKKCCL